MKRAMLAGMVSAVVLTCCVLAHAAPGTIEVHVAGPAAVTLMSGDDVIAVASVAKGARGCLLKGIGAGTYNLVASSSGYASVAKSVTVSDGKEAEVWIELKKLGGDDYEALGRIVGFVKNSAGKPVAGAVLVLLTGDAALGTARSEDPSGVYELEWYTPCTYAVICKADGYKRAVFTDQKITAGDSIRLDIELQPE